MCSKMFSKLIILVTFIVINNSNMTSLIPLIPYTIYDVTNTIYYDVTNTSTMTLLKPLL